jgi:hypothetical protein
LWSGELKKTVQAWMSLEKSNLLYFHKIIGFFPIKCNYFDNFKGLVCGKKTDSGLNDSFLPQSSQRKPQGSQRLGLNESQVAFTTAPLRPLRRHGVLRV